METYSYSCDTAEFPGPLHEEVWGQLPTSPYNHRNESERLRELDQDRGCLQPELHRRENLRRGTSIVNCMLLALNKRQYTPREISFIDSLTWL